MSTLIEGLELDSVKLNEFQKNIPLTFRNKGDPIAAAVARYRTFIARPDGYHAPITEYPYKDEDVKEADSIRTYFKDKIAIEQLSTGRLSSWAADTYSILLGTETLRNRHLGILTRLPFFYYEDHLRHQLAVNYQHLQLQQPTIQTQTRDLKSTVKIWYMRGADKNIEYWFEDQNGHPVKWACYYKNPLNCIVEGLFRRTTAFRVHGIFRLTGGTYADPGIKHWAITTAELV
jgi:hypothetical protein